MLVLCVDWGVNGREPNLEKLVLLGIKSYEKQDFSKAKGYFEKACDLNIGRGCGALGALYYSYIIMGMG